MIHVAIAADRSYWPYVRTLLNSIVAHASQSVTAHLLVRDVSEAVQSAQAWASEKLQINLIDTTGYLDGVRLFLGGHTTRATMDRLLLPELLREPAVDRVIYLDVDVLVLADLLALYERDTGPTGILARPSEHPGFSTVGRCLSSWRHDNIDQVMPHIDSHWPSFNAGVMLLDFARLRERNFVAQVTRFVHDLGVNDQLACAMYARGQFGRLEPNWNVIVGTDHARIAPWHILHWAGPVKPWSSHAALHDRWKKYASGSIVQTEMSTLIMSQAASTRTSY